MNQRPSTTLPITRQDFIYILAAALRVKEFKYAQQIALGWLGFYPGDLEVKLMYARALLLNDLENKNNYSLEKERWNQASHALTFLEAISNIDPEYIHAHRLHLEILTRTGRNIPPELAAAIYILDSKQPDDPSKPRSIQLLKRLYAWIYDQSRPLGTWEQDALTKLLDLFQPVGETASTHLKIFPLAAVIQIRSLHIQEYNADEISKLVLKYLENWPECAALKIILADLYMRSKPEQAVPLLHEAVTSDTTGQIIRRFWGSNHPYLRMWPLDLEIAPGHLNSPQNVPIPARITAVMGWNQLPQPNVQANQDFLISDTQVVSRQAVTNQKALHHQDRESGRSLFDIKNQYRRKPKKISKLKPYPELKEIAHKMKQPALGRIDGRYPVYVILSSWQGLVNQYGQENSNHIIELLQTLSKAVTRYRQWDSLIFLPDMPTLCPDHRTAAIEAIQPDDPWALKLALADLDEILENYGEMIGAVLIVGGPEIVPFHHLPNPVDDSDDDVASDNPYATRDENYFVPEWSVGRLPGGAGKDPQHIIGLLQSIVDYHSGIVKNKSWLSHLIAQVNLVIKRLTNQAAIRLSSYGYSAAIWRRASLSVFRPIGDPRNLWICPPKQVNDRCALHKPNKSCLALPNGSKFAYFNLHGLPDTDEWYGQRDPTEPEELPDFPLALRAADIPLNGNRNSQKPSPEVIFTEACYGGKIKEKGIDDAISLRFLASGSRAVVGSTCISYGSISNPLIAADLLGHAFWHHIKGGQPAGEALRRAKIHLAREMNKRQGYLDGEDQKTLLSFVLYGDPLVQVKDPQRGPKTTIRPNHPVGMVLTTCDRQPTEGQMIPLPDDVMKHVKQLVAVYLPGMAGAEIHLSQERTGCEGDGHQCPSAHLYAKSSGKIQPTGRKVVTLSKTVQNATQVHHQFARMTLNGHGSVTKLAVSR